MPRIHAVWGAEDEHWLDAVLSGGMMREGAREHNMPAYGSKRPPSGEQQVCDFVVLEFSNGEGRSRH